MTAQSHTLQIKGEGGWDRVLFSQFRSDPKTEEGTRVEELLTLLVAANQHLEAWRKDVPLTSKSAFLASMQERNRSEFAYFSTLEKLNELLCRYKWVSAFEGDLSGFRETLKMDGKPPSGNPVWEHAIVRLLLDRIRVPGELARFRHCANCQNWFFAATTHQRFCGEACRRHFTAAGDEFKEKRRLYMQQVYRPQQKERDARAADLAKRRPSKAKKGKL